MHFALVLYFNKVDRVLPSPVSFQHNDSPDLRKQQVKLDGISLIRLPQGMYQNCLGSLKKKQYRFSQSSIWNEDDFRGIMRGKLRNCTPSLFRSPSTRQILAPFYTLLLRLDLTGKSPSSLDEAVRSARVINRQYSGILLFIADLPWAAILTDASECGTELLRDFCELVRVVMSQNSTNTVKYNGAAMILIIESWNIHIRIYRVLRPSPFCRLLSNAFSDFGSVGRSVGRRKKEKTTK